MGLTGKAREMLVTCEFCHRKVLRALYPRHERGHTALRADGQMTEHKTLRPQRRFPGSLEGVPQAYLHPACGQVTVMPEEIVRSYLVDAALYSDWTFCVGCGDYVPHGDVTWVGTGQMLSEYFQQLRVEQGKAGVTPPPGA
jgi:hypothetical protein